MRRAPLLLCWLVSGCLYNKSLYDERHDALVGETMVCHADTDGDGFGAGPSVASPGGDCAAVGFADDATDCDDAAADVFPGAPEVVDDGVDQDCDGGDACHADADGDGFGGDAEVASTDLDCDDPGEAHDLTDCDDTAADVHPGADEVYYDDVDQDCDPADDNDADGDGYDDYAHGGTDCDDTDPSLHPGLNRTYDVPSTDFPTIQSAIDATCDGDTVHLAGNVFDESFDMGHRDIDVVGEGSTSVRGDPADDGPVVRMSRGSLDEMWIEEHHSTGDGACIVVEHGRDVYIGASTSHCDSDGNGGAIAVSDTEGVTILHHAVDSTAAGDGGAIYIRDSSNVVIDQINGSNDEAGRDGGALYAARVDGLQIQGGFGYNVAGEAGGALYFEDVSGITTSADGTLFGWNAATGVGSSVALVGACDGAMRDWAVVDSSGPGQAAMYLQGHLELSNLFVVNSDGAGAHVVPNPGDSVQMTNLLLLGNSGAGLVVQSDDANALHLDNTIIAYNTGYGLLSRGTAAPVVAYSDVYGNTAGDYSGMSAATSFDGNLSVNPKFVQYPTTIEVTGSQFLLAPGSPLIDHGDPELLDPDGTRSDMGLCGGPDALLFDQYEDSDSDAMYDGWESEHSLDTTRDDSAEDPDSDGLTNLEEFGYGTDPSSDDSDGDGVLDKAEIDAHTNPIDDTSH